MINYWHQRDITQRLIAERADRMAPREGTIDGLLEQLSPHMVLAIANELNDGGLITQTTIEDEY